jgi:dTDP-4-dehydrorhamnose 3,5-epimerase
MIFERTAIPGAWLVGLEKHADHRGYFARAWCMREFEEHGITEPPVQMNHSYNRYKNTLRGFHYQVEPWQEAKLLRCIRGAVHDVLVDLRKDSPTYLHHISVVLSSENHRMLLVPKGCANAFLTMQDETEVTYLVSQYYTPEAERGVRWNDPALNIDWPVKEPAIISDKDQSWPDFH